MRTILIRTISAVVLLCLLYGVAIAAGNATTESLPKLPPEPAHDAGLDAALDSMVRDSLSETGLTEDRVHIALIDLGDPQSPRTAHFRGDVPVYPASVVKMFYMGYVYHLVERGELELTPELRGQLTQMIRPSSNVATGTIVDTWSGTHEEKLLPPGEYEDFAAKRNACNRWLQRVLNIEDVNANQKTWGGTIPDAERQFLSGGEFGGPWVNRNSMTAMAAARYLQLLAQDRLASPESCEAMRTLMKRDVNEQPYQKRRIAGGAPQGAQVYSKTGTTSDTFHDAGIVQLPGGRTFVLATLITGTGAKGDFIPALTRRASEYLISEYEASAEE
ncbi:MAG: serine hydrolase [Oceanidesulfovibrio sp.]